MPLGSVANDRLRHILIGYARVSKADGHHVDDAGMLISCTDVDVRAPGGAVSYLFANGRSARVDRDDVHGESNRQGVGVAVELKGSLMDPCVYTTQHGTWLHAAVGCSPKQLVCFRSVKRWTTARQLLIAHTTLPVLFRKQDETTPVLACRFVAELVEIHFADDDQFANDRARLDWLEARLWLQRDTIKNQPRTAKFPTPQAQFKEWEIDKFMKAMTWFSVRNVRKIKPLPLPRLRKLKDNRPLSPKFVRGYALCRYPKDEIRTFR